MSDPYKIQASKLFFNFFQDNQIFPLEKVLDSAIYLLENGAPYRDLVLEFFTTLFRECCQQYCLINSCLKHNVKHKKTRFIVLMQFIKALNQSPATTSSKYRNDEISKTEPMEIIEDCPLSPPKEPIDDFDKEDLSLGNHVQNDLLVVMNLIDKQLPRIATALINLLKRDQNRHHQHVRISDWALTLATNISIYKNNLIEKSDPMSLSLVKALSFWKPCSFMQVLIRIVFNSIDMIEPATLINQILKYSPSSDWILANLLTAISDNRLLTQYLDLLINHSSSFATIYILSYVSEHNPYAIVNCSKSNIPFLLNLCTNSKPLLDLLAQDIVKKVNVQTMNEFAELHTFDELNSSILYCILNAPNAFQLLKISFNLIVNSNSSEKLIEKVLNILSLMVKQMNATISGTNHLIQSNTSSMHFSYMPHLLQHNTTYDGLQSNAENLALQRKNTNYLLAILRNHIQELVDYFFFTRNPQLKKIQMKLVNLTCINYGREFIVEVFHYLMNLPQQPAINISNYTNPKLSNQFLTLLNSLRIDSGYEVYDCIKETLDLQKPKKLDFWANLMVFIESKPIEFETSILVQYLNQNINEDYTDIIRVYYILRIFLRVFDHYQELYSRQQYRLCVALINIYFELIDIMNDNDDEKLLILIMDCLVICQKFLKNFSESLPLNECIILRCTLDFIRQKSHLFTNYYPVNSINAPTNNGHQWPSLLNENMNSNNNLKMKKNPLIPFYSAQKKQRYLNKNSSLNKRLVLDLLEHCVNDTSLFAENFTNSLSNQLLLRDVPILEEDPKDGQVQHLRVRSKSSFAILNV